MALCMAYKKLYAGGILYCSVEIPHELHYDPVEHMEWRELPDISVTAVVSLTPPLKAVEAA